MDIKKIAFRKDISIGINCRETKLFKANEVYPANPYFINRLKLLGISYFEHEESKIKKAINPVEVKKVINPVAENKKSDKLEDNPFNNSSEKKVKKRKGMKKSIE